MTTIIEIAGGVVNDITGDDNVIIIDWDDVGEDAFYAEDVIRRIRRLEGDPEISAEVWDRLVQIQVAVEEIWDNDEERELGEDCIPSQQPTPPDTLITMAGR